MIICTQKFYDNGNIKWNEQYLIVQTPADVSKSLKEYLNRGYIISKRDKPKKRRWVEIKLMKSRGVK